MKKITNICKGFRDHNWIEVADKYDPKIDYMAAFYLGVRFYTIKCKYCNKTK